MLVQVSSTQILAASQPATTRSRVRSRCSAQCRSHTRAPAANVSWTRVPSSSSPPAFASQIVYHASADQLLAYGAGPSFGETWVFQGTTWTNRISSSTPGRRFAPGLCYRSASKDVFLFGGDNGLPSPYFYPSLGDAWSWDGVAWRLLAARGPARSGGMGMAYDSVRDRVVIFGGTFSTGTAEFLLGDTWEWDGVKWINIMPPVAPSPKTGPAMAFDPIRKRVVLFGGGGQNDTWGVRWCHVDPEVSVECAEPAMVVDGMG